MTFEFTSNNQFYVGIGASDMGIVPTKPIAEQSPFIMKLYNGGYAQCAPTSEAGGDGWPFNDSWRTDADTQNVNSVHTCKIVVNNGKVALYIDGHRLGGGSHSYSPLNYKGGHIFFILTDYGESIKLPTVKETDVNKLFEGYTSFEATSNYNALFWPTGLTQQEKITDNLTYAMDDRIGPYDGATQTVLYSNEKYTNFDMSFDYTSNSHLYVGIGAEEMGTVPTKPISDHSPFVMRLFNSGILQAAPTNAAGGDGWPYNESWRTPADTQNNTSVHNCRIVVSGGGVAIYIDGHRLVNDSYSYSPLNYKGGHIFFIFTDAVETISVPVIKDISVTEEFENAFTPYHSTTFTQVTTGEGEEAKTVTKPYWANDLSATSDINEDWYTDENGMLHKNGKVRMSTLYLDGIYGQNTRITFNYKSSAQVGNFGLYVGFGSQEMGEDWWQGQNSITANIARILVNGTVGYSPNTDGFGDTYIFNGMDSIFKQGAIDNSCIHEIVLEVKLNTVYAWIDGIYRGSAELTNFEDGYIFFAAERGDIAFSMPVIEEITLPKYGDENSNAYGKKALFIGDSIGDGAGDKAGWHYRLGWHYDMQVTNNSAGGWILADDDATGLGSIQDQLTNAIGENYDYIIVEGGINDIMRHVNTNVNQCVLGEISTSYDIADFDKTTTAGALESIFYNATTKFGNDTKVGFIMVYKPTISWIGDWTTAEEYVDTYLAICEKWGVSVFNMWDDDELTATLRESDNLLTDGLHFAHDGYDYVDEAMADWFDTLVETEYAGYGHVNNDGVINVLDLIRMKKLQAAETVEYYLPADVTKDGKFDTNDLADMRKFIIGAKEGF